MQMRLKKEEMYDFRLISPAQAEKLLKKENPRRWTKVEALIPRVDGKPTVVPASDSRPTLNVSPANDFDDIEAKTVNGEGEPRYGGYGKIMASRPPFLHTRRVIADELYKNGLMTSELTDLLNVPEDLISI